jgi:hypothetical protein
MHDWEIAWANRRQWSAVSPLRHLPYHGFIEIAGGDLLPLVELSIAADNHERVKQFKHGEKAVERTSAGSADEPAELHNSKVCYVEIFLLLERATGRQSRTDEN